MTKKYTLSYYKLSADWIEESEDFETWDEATEKAHKLDLDFIDFEKSDISITEFSLDEEGNIEAPESICKALIEDGEIVDWIE
jgi:hypothetical protein